MLVLFLGGPGILLPSQPARCLLWGFGDMTYVFRLFYPWIQIPVLKCGCMCLVIKRFLYFSSLPGSCVCRLGPPLQESLHLNCFGAWASSSSEKLGWSVWTETNGFEACKLNSALFLLGLHNFNDREVKQPFKQNRNLVLDFQIQL